MSAQLFPGNTQCHLRNGIPIDFLGKFNQLPMKTYSGCFHLSYISRLIFPSLGISSLNPGLFNACPLLGKLSCCQQNGMLAPAKPLRNEAQRKRACHSSVTSGGVTSKPWRTVSAPTPLARGLGKLVSSNI